MTILNYLTIGIIFGFLVELSANAVKKWGDWPFKPSEDPYNYVMRLLVVLLWPAGVIVFIYGWIKGYRNTKR